MLNLLILRVFHNGKLGNQLEVALGHSGEYPRVTFRATVVLPAFLDDSASLRDLLEELGEELFNVGAYADTLRDQESAGALGEDPQSSAQLILDATLDGGGWGGPAGDGQQPEGLPREVVTWPSTRQPSSTPGSPERPGPPPSSSEA